MTRPIAILACAALLLTSTSALAASAHRPHLAGVDLTRVSALGTEPFWSVDITARHLVVKGSDAVAHYAPNPGPRVSRTRATWRTHTHEHVTLTVVLTRETCSDGMSDTVYPLKADVTIGEVVFSGCAEQTERRH